MTTLADAPRTPVEEPTGAAAVPAAQPTVARAATPRSGGSELLQLPERRLGITSSGLAVVGLSVLMLVLRRARAHRGVAVLAHPGRLAPAERDRVVGEALEAGLDGIEVWHSQHDAELRRSLDALVARRGLLATGGSDYHGRHKPDVRVGTGTGGNVAVPSEYLAALRDRLASSGPAA